MNNSYDISDLVLHFISGLCLLKFLPFPVDVSTVDSLVPLVFVGSFITALLLCVSVTNNMKSSYDTLDLINRSPENEGVLCSP